MTIKPINKTLKYWKKFNLTKGAKYDIYINSEIKNEKVGLFLNDKYKPVGIDLSVFDTEFWEIEK